MFILRELKKLRFIQSKHNNFLRCTYSKNGLFFRNRNLLMPQNVINQNTVNYHNIHETIRLLPKKIKKFYKKSGFFQAFVFIFGIIFYTDIVLISINRELVLLGHSEIDVPSLLIFTMILCFIHTKLPMRLVILASVYLTLLDTFNMEKLQIEKYMIPKDICHEICWIFSLPVKFSLGTIDYMCGSMLTEKYIQKAVKFVNKNIYGYVECTRI